METVRQLIDHFKAHVVPCAVIFCSRITESGDYIVRIHYVLQSAVFHCFDLLPHALRRVFPYIPQICAERQEKYRRGAC
jgi:hypothetical protein